MAIPTTYTGQNSGAAPIFQGGKTTDAVSRGLSQMLQVKQQDVAMARQDEKDFLSAIQSDPVSIANTQAMTRQQEMIEAYQTKYSNLYRERQGRLTTSDKVEMQASKQAITAYQAQVQGGYDRYLQDVQRYTSSPSRYSSRNFEQGIKNYLEGDGTYQGGIVTPAPTSYDNFVKKHRLLAQGGTSMEKGGMWLPRAFQPGPGGKGVTVYDPVMTEDDARQFFYRSATNTDGDLQLIMEMWDEASPDMRAAVIANTDAQNELRQDETQKLNPALEYAFNQPELRGAYLNPRPVQGSQPVSMTQAAQPITAALDFAVKTGRVPGIRESVGMEGSVQKGFSGEIGTNLDAMTFTFGTANMWQKLPVRLIDNAPEDVKLAGELADARIRAVANGKAEWTIRVPTREKVKSTSALASGSMALKSGYEVQSIDGKNQYFKVDYRERSVVTDYQPVAGIINTEFPNAAAVIDDRGYNVPKETTATEDDEFSQYKR